MKEKISLIVITVVITALVVYFFIPSKTITVPHTIIQADTGKVADTKVAEVIKERDAILKENGWLKRQLKLAQIQTPVNGAVSNPTTSPVAEINPPRDSAHVPMLYPYDYPFSIMATKGKITFLTINPYLRYFDKPYIKTYEYERTTSDFEFALTPTVDPNKLDGIVLKARERFFSFDGITVGCGAMFPKHFYALIEMNFSMYERLYIYPRITSFPEIGIELKYGIVP